MEQIDLTKQVPERGYFNPSRAMLDLTNVFIETLKAKLEQEIIIQVLSPHKTLIFIMVDTNIAEVYGIINDGISAQWMYQGMHHKNNK